jgi:hypothetical protein
METKRERRLSVLRPAGLYLAMLLTAALFAACWWQLLDGATWLVVASCFGSGAVLGLAWHSRVRAMQRLRVAVDVYAEREIAREMTRRAGASGMFDEPGRHIAA